MEALFYQCQLMFNGLQTYKNTTIQEAMVLLPSQPEVMACSLNNIHILMYFTTIFFNQELEVLAGSVPNLDLDGVRLNPLV